MRVNSDRRDGAQDGVCRPFRPGREYPARPFRGCRWVSSASQHLEASGTLGSQRPDRARRKTGRPESVGSHGRGPGCAPERLPSRAGINSARPLAQPLTTPDDNAWDDLLSFIEEQRVIPIVGPELLLLRTDAGPRPPLGWVAEKLAARLNADVAELPKPDTLNDVACWFLAARGRREDAYVRLRGIL